MKTSCICFCALLLFCCAGFFFCLSIKRSRRPITDLEGGGADLDPFVPHEVLHDIIKDWVKVIKVEELSASDYMLVRRTMGYAAWDAMVPDSDVELELSVDANSLRKHAPERNFTSQIIAVNYAMYNIALTYRPESVTSIRNYMFSIELDPDDDSLDIFTPVGVGNFAGKKHADDLANILSTSTTTQMNRDSAGLLDA
jgi:hypothetical protein